MVSNAETVGLVGDGPQSRVICLKSKSYRFTDLHNNATIARRFGVIQDIGG